MKTSTNLIPEALRTAKANEIYIAARYEADRIYAAALVEPRRIHAEALTAIEVNDNQPPSTLESKTDKALRIRKAAIYVSVRYEADRIFSAAVAAAMSTHADATEVADRIHECAIKAINSTKK